MPAILIGAAVVSLGSTLWANRKRKKAAEDAQIAMNAENDARQEQINQALSDLDALASGEVKIPIDKPEVAPKVEVEKGKIGDNYFDALDTAKSDAAINEQVKQSEKALSAQLDVSDPRIKAAVAAKAVDAFNDQQAEIQAQGKQDITEAQMAVGRAQTENELDFARRQTQADEAFASRLQSAENMYSQQLNQYLQNEYNRLQGLIGENIEEQYGLQYGAATVLGQAQAQGAADFAGAVGDTAGMLVGTLEDGGKIPNAAEQGKRVKSFDHDRINDLILEARMGGKFSFEQGGSAAMTRGEFNHGDPSRPETGNDQVLIDQEDLKSGLETGQIKSYEDIEDNNMVQAVTTGGELIFNDKDSGNIESLTMDTDPNDSMNYARNGKRVKKGKKKSKAEIRKAEAALAAYMRNLLSQDQFQT